MRKVIEFDHHSTEYALAWQSMNSELQRHCPVSWTESRGGFWLLTRYADVQRAATDNEAFSQDNDLYDERNCARGVSVPRSTVRMLPVESDPPLTLQIRAVLKHHFNATAAQRLVPTMELHVKELLDSIMETGSIDFVADLVIAAPMKLALGIIGFPLDDWREIARTSRDIFSTPSDSPRFAEVVERMGRIDQQLRVVVAERRRAATEDVISSLVRGEIEGSPISDDAISAVLLSLVLGGSDTTGALTASALGWLDHNATYRQQPGADYELLDRATDEFLRVFPPNHTLARTAMHDVDLGGQLIRKGDQVLMSWAAANRDPLVFERPDEVLLERGSSRHTSFGLGVHHCLGSHIARMEFKVMLGQILRRMPDYRIDWEHTVRFSNIGTLDGFLAMPATFAPTGIS
jgi:cytochrome P450